MQIHKVNRAVLEFLGEMFEGEANIISVVKQGKDGWLVTCEVFEPSKFIKSIGLKTKVMDRNFYEVELSSDLEITSYTKIESPEN